MTGHPPDSPRNDTHLPYRTLVRSGLHGGWELPGPNQHVGEARELEIASAGAAARHEVRVAMPDWTSVAVDYDGVHLSWTGMLLAEGHVISVRSEEHTSELQSLMRISYAVFCLKKQK